MDIWGILEYTASATVIGLLIWLIKLIFHDKLDARWLYFIWLVLFVRLAVPVHFRFLSTPLSVFQDIPLGKWVEMGRLTAEKRGLSGLFDTLWAVYLGGAVLLGLIFLAMWALLRVQVAQAPRADEELQAYVDGIAAKYGLKSFGDIRVRQSRTPYVCGVVRSVLVVPESRTPEEAVIVHELLHNRYRDVLVNLIVHIVRVVNWFNPIVWTLTAAALNDCEALCDQRVLERCGEENEKHYGELLIAMGEGRERQPVKVGTSNMASSYLSMKTRIRRIREFRRVPEGIGLVTLCITLMLAVAGVSSAEESGFTVPHIGSAKDLERALLYARCYHAHTPEEAVYLFLRAYMEGNAAYRMAVMPEAEVAEYEEFVEAWFAEGKNATYAEVAQKRGNPLYFPRETARMCAYRIYNMQYDESGGSATVCAIPYVRSANESYAEWRLTLKKEDGWKVWLEEESGMLPGQYRPQPLVGATAQVGDFLVEATGYNEGVFQQLGAADTTPGFFLYQDSGEAETDWPTFFSIEYKITQVHVSYLGEEPLTGREIRVVTGPRDAAAGDSVREYSSWAAKDATPSEDDAGSAQISRYYGSADNHGNGISVFDGAKLASGEPWQVYGHGNGFSEAGHEWKLDDKVGVYIWIYVDGILTAEGGV